MNWIVYVTSIVLAGALSAQSESRPQQTFEMIELRITSVAPGGRAMVDRGESDGLLVGAAVVFQPRQQGPVWGNIIELFERTSVVRFNDPNSTPPPGSRGRVRVPRSRHDAETPLVPVPDAPPDATLEHPPWSNEDQEWVSGQPLLARVESVPPQDRPSSFNGRAWTSADLFVATDERTDGFYRGGLAVSYDNLFGQGGRLYFEGELTHRHALAENLPDESKTLTRLDRFAYAWGGTRYRPDRVQAGRFLQHGMPEFGELDGIEWSHRLANGHRFGSSIGWMPEPDANHTTGRDFQIAGWYEWVRDESEELALAAGYQKTFHGGAPDRDLLVARMHWLPVRGWTAHASAFVDLYSASDDAKDASLGLTHANASLRREYRDAGINFTYAHQEFPEIDREEIPSIAANSLLDPRLDDRLDRLAASGWTRVARDLRLRGHVAGWIDEDDAGSDGELALSIDEPFVRGGRAELALFGNLGQFTTGHGARASYGHALDHGRWDLLYELADYRFKGFNANNDDLLQHRLRGAHEFYTDSGWTLSWYAEGLLRSDEWGAAIGAFLQRSF